MLRMLASVAALGLIAAPALAATSKTTVKHQAAKAPAKTVAVKKTTTTTKTK